MGDGGLYVERRIDVIDLEWCVNPFDPEVNFESFCTPSRVERSSGKVNIRGLLLVLKRVHDPWKLGKQYEV